MKIERVLIVDDDEDVRAVCALAARKLGGWEVVEAAGGEEALAAARSEQPDVILLDVMMPGMDGPGVLLRLREDRATEKIPVIFLTARAQTRELADYLERGASGVIVKPFDVTGFVAEIRRLVGGD